MQEEWDSHILRMVPEHLRQAADLKEYLAELFEEIRKDYYGSMKKSMGMFTQKSCVKTNVLD